MPDPPNPRSRHGLQVDNNSARSVIRIVNDIGVTMKVLPFLLASLISVGCVSIGIPSAGERAAIRESVFRFMCQPEPTEQEVSHSINRVHKVYFLSVGHLDPSPEFLKRLTGLSAPVKPISAGKWKGSFIYDRVTGERGAAFYVRRTTMLSKDEADVEAEIRPGGGKSASGSIYRVTRKGGRWVVTGKQLKWIS